MTDPSKLGVEDRKTLYIELANLKASDLTYDQSTVLGFINWLYEVMSKVPVKYRGQVRLELETDAEWDSYYTTIRVHYDRPETDEEMDHRHEMQAAADRDAERRRAKVVADVEAGERLLYERLKLKFENKEK